MTNREQKKVRFVKCPKCSRILPEPEDVPLYTCGVCGTILQAKYYKSDKAGVPLTTRPNEVQNFDVGHGLEVKKLNGSSLESSSSGEQPTTQNEKKDEKAVDHCNSEQIGTENPAHCNSWEQKSILESKEDRVVIESEREFSSEDEATVKKRVQLLAASADSAVPSIMDIVGGSKEALDIPMESEAVEKNNGQDEQIDDITDENQDNKQRREVNGTCEVRKERQCEVLGNKEPQNEDNKHDYVFSDKLEDVALKDSVNDVSSDKLEDVALMDSVNEVSMSIESQPTKTALQFAPGTLAAGSNSDHGAKKMTVDVEHLSEVRNQINLPDADMPIADTELLKVGSGEEQNKFVECVREKLESVTLSSEDPSATKGSMVGVQGSLGAHGSCSMPSTSSATYLKSVSEKSISPENECGIKTEHFNNPAVKGEELGISSEKSASSELVDTQEELGHLLEAVQRSPTKGFLAYDGSVSSYDGNDDQVPAQPRQDREETSRGNDVIAGFSKESSEWNDVPSRTTHYRNTGTRARANISASLMSDEELRSSVLEEEESARGNGVPGSDRNRLSKHMFPPRIPFYRRSSEVAFETGSSSGYVHSHPYRYEENQEPWQRIAYSRGYNDRRRFPEAEWRRGNFPPMLYHDDISGEMYHRPRYDLGYNDRRRRAGSWSLSGNLPQTRYSGEVSNGKYQFQDPHMHRHPDDLRWSAQFPPSTAYYRQGPRPFLPPWRETGWNPYDSYSMSPPRHIETEPYAWAPDTAYLSDDPRHKDRIMQRMYSREQHQVVKRHLRPMAGGAPFINCYFCYKVVQLPEDFLISKRRRNHRLKCGSCLNILQYSLENESCLAPSMPHSSEATATFVERASSSHVNHSHGSDLVSGGAHQHNSFGALSREKSQLMSRNSRNGETRDESYEARPSSAQSKQVKVTWQLPAKNKSPLHRLMGYSTPQDMLTSKRANDVEEMESNRVAWSSRDIVLIHKPTKDLS